MKKHVLHLHDVLQKLDSQKRIFPNGLVGSLERSSDKAERIKRIELFAEKQSRESYGIIRQFFVAYSSEKSVLQLAQASENVISVRALQDSTRLGEGSQIRKQVDNRMILKRAEEVVQADSYRPRIPNLIVSNHWLEIMQLEPGDRIIISNPIENYMVPPPGLEELN
jgi:hypothetical protein